MFQVLVEGFLDDVLWILLWVLEDFFIEIGVGVGVGVGGA